MRHQPKQPGQLPQRALRQPPPLQQPLPPCRGLKAPQPALAPAALLWLLQGQRCRLTARFVPGCRELPPPLPAEGTPVWERCILAAM